MMNFLRYFMMLTSCRWCWQFVQQTQTL